MPQCTAINARGERCRTPGRLGRTPALCTMHDPERVEEAQAARRRGGASRARNQREGLRRIRALRESELPKDPETIEDVHAWSLFLLRRGATGHLDPRIHGACNRTLERVLRPLIEALETSREVRRLKAELAEFTAARRLP